MSYCRFSDGDVYLYPSVIGGWTCCACRLNPVDESGAYNLSPDTRMLTAGEVRAHLQAHIDADHDVPDYATEKIDTEIAERGAGWDGYG